MIRFTITMPLKQEKPFPDTPTPVRVTKPSVPGKTPGKKGPVIDLTHCCEILEGMKLSVYKGTLDFVVPNTHMGILTCR